MICKLLFLSIISTYEDQPKDELVNRYEGLLQFIDRATSRQNVVTSLTIRHRASSM